MKILPDPLCFEWDSGNSEKNLIKHKVTNQESEEVFRNKPVFISKDTLHSTREERYQALGTTNRNRLLFVSFTRRKESIRIISVRDMSVREHKVYVKKVKAITGV